ncbi:phosphoenolpyruvate synthase [bacterium (Candidatus Gribaldobacteria) CG_4_10_14_0_8_um_filter_33_9]|uniref:Phosphoenolpyruvate synthase n=1 Tax=bacterium (Candidatus Gribaldobacteria) CG_4_10_14_0_8_um_filter_33_9 TaxID=2014266 RepID=A0A2M7RNZ6_9BACT|nr:MAG: phosphoenolpyruvate synthase [bacterium (Candidatus Gribaldobacteria) CG_4_10_14_0_8_um_filter_33_9]
MKKENLQSTIYNLQSINVPNGFALTSEAYWRFLEFNKLDEKLKKVFEKFNPKSIRSLQEAGKTARNLILKAEFPEYLKEEIFKAYKILSQKYGGKNTSVAVRSSGVAEDAPTMSFAGMFETFLNVSGEENLLKAIKKCLASSFGDRVISYREEKGISQLKVALSVGIQKMIRSDLASSGVIFTMDTETGFENVVLINSIYGIGEMIVKGKITADEFYVFKPTLMQGYKSIILKNLGRKTKKYIYNKIGGLKEAAVSLKDKEKFSLIDDEILTLARWACEIEKHYECHQDIEWAKDGKTGDLFIVQSRPETVFASQKNSTYEEYKIKTNKSPILTGIAVGNKVGQGKVRIIQNVSKIGEFKKGEVLVTRMTDPDWLPVIRIAAAIVTDEGSRVCHAAIVSRELGIPCIVGTLKGTEILKFGKEITVDCASGAKGRIFEGKIPFEIKKYDLGKLPKLKTKVMVNIGTPEIAFKTSFLPVDGVGLAREEFIIAEKIKIHPLALYHYKELQIPNSKFQIQNKFQITNSKIQKIINKINEITIEHKDKREFFVKELAEGIGQIAAAFWPREVIVRFSDFKTNEYKNLIGGELFEKEEENPMLGFRGVCRYLDKKFQPVFQMECDAIKRCREIFGLENISLMVPFCRTLEEGKMVIDLIKKFGLGKRKGLKIYVMAEIPSNVILAKEFLEIFDGMSIGSNDLTQLVLGVDRDNAKIAYIGNEQNKAVKEMIKQIIKICRQKKKYCGICGEATSVPEMAKFLVGRGIESLSVSPGSVIKTILLIRNKK